MIKEHTTHLEHRVNELRTTCAMLADTDDLEKFLIQIRQPGFTTPAEYALLQSLLETIVDQSKAVVSLRRVLVSAAEKVELNPQPLPPRAER